MRGVGRGGKLPFGEQRFKGVENFLLVLFNRQQVITSLLVEDLLHMLHLGVSGVGQHDFVHQFELGQLLATRRDFVAAFLDRGGA